MEKNNLDDLFKDKFKAFSETPDERVWENIEASLNKKKKKRIVPIWWQLGGAAAALALLLYFINPFESDEKTTLPTLVDTEEKGPVDSEQDTETKNSDAKTFQESQESQVVDASDSNSSSKGSGTLESEKLDTKTTGNRNSSKTQQSIISKGEVVADNTASPEESTDETDFALEEKKQNGIQNLKETAVVENKKVEGGQKEQEKILSPNKPFETKEEVAVAENEDMKDDTISIFDAIKEQEGLEEEAVADNSRKRWSMGPSVAPVFFSSVGEGSPIHSNFASNSKSGNLNLSYGLQVTYNINKKLSIRSGVHRVDYGYDTNDVVFTSSLTTSTNQLIDNITYAQTSRNLVVESKSNEVEALSDNASVGGTAQPFEGRMVQQLGYVEVPMELNYALLDKKFGINLIGGVSSLFLVDNAVSLESDQLITEMGEANNANDVNFSTNIGVGFNYEISQKLQLNVEPIFKYQLNTFSETAGNFRPYSVGVYSGLSFRF